MRASFIDHAKARPDALHRRALVVAAMLAFWMFVIAVRLAHLQASQHDWLKGRALAQHQAAAGTSPLRGLILDRHGRELARSVETYSFFVDPGEVENVEEVVARLESVVEIDGAALVARLRKAKERGGNFVWVARKLDAARAASIHALNAKGVHSRKEPKRFYPNNGLAAHVLGFVDVDERGLAGIEQFHNKRVRGEAGAVFVERDGNQDAFSSLEVQGRPGQSIVLTIDQLIQYHAEQALAAAVEKARAKSGTAVVLDPRTGEILALASAPTFDPNDARAASPEARSNQALQNIYEPGSTFKIVAFSAAIEERLAKPDDRIDCQMGSITVAGRTVRDHHPFGTLTITDALAKSSNVAAIKLGLRVGDASMYDYMTRFGFGSRTGIELPGETVGLLRPVARWQKSSIGSLAIGQEIGVTPLQMAAAFGALANDGVRVAPHVVREVRALDETPLSRAQPEQRRVVSIETARALRGMLESVTLKGTAKLAQLDGYTAAGKTGTAQKIDPVTKAYSLTKHVASFVGFAPVENPAVVIVVVIDEPVGAYHGGDVAAPVFREIAEKILPGMNVAPDADFKTAPELTAQSAADAEDTLLWAGEELLRENEERRATLPQVAQGGARAGVGEIVYAAATKRAALMPDLRGRSVRDAARVCAHLGLQLEARGQGRAVRQHPTPGAEVEDGQVVRIDFGRSE